jgi:hypothetical protein
MEVKLTLMLVVVALQFVLRRRVWFVHHQPIHAVNMHRAPLKMVLKRIRTPVLVGREIVQHRPVCFAWVRMINVPKLLPVPKQMEVKIQTTVLVGREIVQHRLVCFAWLLSGVAHRVPTIVLNLSTSLR